MGLTDGTAYEYAHKLQTIAAAAGLLHGAVGVVEQGDRWVRPLRFSEEQLRALGSCQAWHPGLYRQMARTTSGITVEFETDARELALEIRVDEEPQATRSVLALLDQGELLPHDGVSADIDGRHVWCGMPSPQEPLVTVALAGHDPEDELGLQPLPGMGRTRHVRIWLPVLRSCSVRDLRCDGTFIQPVQKRKNLLVLGDSIVQGFVSEDPALAWPSLLAARLKLDLVNQGIAGQVFQPGSLVGLVGLLDVERIVVAFGENYRFEPCRVREVARDVHAYLAEVARLWPEVPTHVLSPLWHDEQAHPSHRMSCHAQLPELIASNVAAFPQMTYVDGLELLDHDLALFADGCTHPGTKGCRQIAMRLNGVMRIPGLRPSSVGRRRPKKKAKPVAEEPVGNDNALQLPLG